MPKLDFDLTDLLAVDFDPRRTKVWIDTNVTGPLVDTTNKQIRIGPATATVGNDGKGSFAGLIATNSTDLRVDQRNFLYQVHVDYSARGARERGRWDSGWFALTADSDLSLVATVPNAPAVVTQDSVLASTVSNPGSQTSAALSATIAAQAAVTDGTPRVMKGSTDTRSGVLDWEYDSPSGYLLHLRAGDDSTASAAAFGIGTDKGSGSAGVMALKNDGNGLQIGSHPSHTGKAFTLSSYGPSATPAEISLFSGAKALLVQHKKGQGYSDGATTNGSATLTSATAAFTAGDVGKTLTQTTSRGEGFGAIPTGATIASVTNATTVVMSAPSTRTATGINFLVGDRAVPATQGWLSFYNADAEEVVKFSPALAAIKSRAEFYGSTSTTAPSTYINGASCKFYTHNGTNYSTHEIAADAFAWRLRHYAAAGKGSESGPVQSIIATVSGGTPRLGFFGAGSTARPTVTGSRSDGTALASLLTALATLGLIADSTTA